MVKMHKILLLFISVLVFANSFNDEFANFDKSFLLLDKARQLESHQKLKTIYIKSIISNDDEAKKEVLKRIVLSSRALKLNATTYEKELQDLGINPNKLSFKPISKQEQPKQNIEQKAMPKKEQKQAVVNEKPKQEQKQTIVKKEEKPKEDIKSNKVYITKLEELKEGIKLTLKGELDKDNIKVFKYANSQIMEFICVLDIGKQHIQKDNYEISVVQFNPEKSRIVFKTNEDFALEYEIKDGFLYAFFTNKQEIKKEIKVEKPKEEPKKEIKKETKKIEAEKPKIEKPKEESKPQIKEEPKAQDKVLKTLYIVNVSKLDNGVVLDLKNDIDENSIKISSYGKNQILEFDGVLNGARRNYDFKNSTISVLQFNPKKVRVVLNSKANNKINYKLDDNKLYVFAGEMIETKTSFNKSKLLITLDAGHGGKDAGANAYKRYEKNITLAIVLKLEKALKQKGYRVFLTRKKDIYLGLRERTKMANEKKSDLFISIHANSIADKSKLDKIYGIETYFLSPARSERSKNAAAIENKSDIEEMNYFSKQTFLNFLNREKIISSNKLAIDIQGGILSAIPKKYKAKDGGVKEAPFWVLVGALMPAVLIEVGYISHPEESKNIADPIYQNHLVNGIVNGIESYFEKNKK